MTSDAIFCPTCQRKNPTAAESCIYCGTSLTADNWGIKTTEEMGGAQRPSIKTTTLLDRAFPQLPKGSLAMFIMDELEPILVEDMGVLYLGRYGGIVPPASIDLSHYKADELGVSRSHARISLSEGVYSIEDLASTNGTWLNQARLACGKSYELHNGDVILLGFLHLTIYLPEQAVRRAVTFTAQRTLIADTGNLRNMTLQYLVTVVSKLLYALIEVDSIYQASRGRPAENVHIHSIRSDEEKPLIYISLDKGGEAIHLVRKWIVPWQRAHPLISTPKQILEDEKISREFRRIAGDILLDANPSLDEEDQQALVEKLLPPLFVLATSELELSPPE